MKKKFKTKMDQVVELLMEDGDMLTNQDINNCFNDFLKFFGFSIKPGPILLPIGLGLFSLDIFKFLLTKL